MTKEIQNDPQKLKFQKDEILDEMLAKHTKGGGINISTTCSVSCVITQACNSKSSIRSYLSSYLRGKLLSSINSLKLSK